MLIQRFKSKIHRATVTEANLNYIGSITIDEDLMDASSIFEGERVQIVNNNNGERIETYVIPGKRGSGVICLNGAAARRTQVGDIVIIISYGLMTIEEAKSLIQSVRYKNVIGGDVVCLMPTKDNPNNITSMVAASIMFEIISVIAS